MAKDKETAETSAVALVVAYPRQNARLILHGLGQSLADLSMLFVASSGHVDAAPCIINS